MPIHQLPRLSTCRSCRAETAWVVTPKGKWLMLDRQPVQEPVTETHGLMLLEANGRVRFATDADASRPISERRSAFYRAHFTTCPHSKLWRNKRGTSD